MARLRQGRHSKFEPKGFGLRLLDEIQNEGIVHHELVAKIEHFTQRNLVSYSSLFEHPAGTIADHDPQLIETLLQSLDLTQYPDTLDLMLNSPGGSPTAAEKVVLTCRAYAKSFRVIVPQSAMSAATMIAMGADSILMTETSELGPIDPQMIFQVPGGHSTIRPAKAFIDAYSDLVSKTQEAILAQKPPHPYIELLRKLDPSWIQVCLKARKLAGQIAEDFLSRWMLCGKAPDDIKKVVSQFLAQGEEGSHGRAIRAEKAKSFGLEKVGTTPTGQELWKAIWELYQRTQRYLQQRGLAKYLVARNGGINVQAQIMQIN